VVRGGVLTGWISVHVEAGRRRWSEADVRALETAIERVRTLLSEINIRSRLV
jgi:hypothetical protein